MGSLSIEEIAANNFAYRLFNDCKVIGNEIDSIQVNYQLPDSIAQTVDGKGGVVTNYGYGGSQLEALTLLYEMPEVGIIHGLMLLGFLLMLRSWILYAQMTLQLTLLNGID